MKRALIAGLLICGAAPLPAQVCDQTSTSYNAVACAMMMKNQSGKRDRAFYVWAAEDRRKRWAQRDAQNPPVIVDSRPGHRVAPRRLASHTQGADARQVETVLEAVLAEFERVARNDPNVLLSMPLKDLATAFTWLGVRSYMVLRGLNDVSPELVREEYFFWRTVFRRADYAKFVADAGEVQFEYERALIVGTTLSAQWEAALASGNQASRSAVQKTAEQNLQYLYKEPAALAPRVREMDNDERFDLMARQDNMCPWDGRVTLSIKPPAALTEGDSSAPGPRMTPGPTPAPGGVWRQFDFRQSEDYEYEILDDVKKLKGNVRIESRISASGAVALSIKASLGEETLDQVIHYKLSTGLPLVAGLPWAKAGLGKVLASTLLLPRPELTARALTNDANWTSHAGSTEMKTFVVGPCDRGPGLAGQFVTLSPREGATPSGAVSYCVGSGVPLPIQLISFTQGVNVTFNLNRRTPAAPAPDLAGKPR